MSKNDHTVESDQLITPLTSGLPLVVQIGFSGSRKLYDPAIHPSVNRQDFERAVEQKLQAELEGLPAFLGLGTGYFLCGISQIAIGADTCFARACNSLNIRHRIFLPQPRDEFLLAGNKNGVPDFSEEEKNTALEILTYSNIIQERVVSESTDRTCRFEDTNIEIARICDVAICLLRTDSRGSVGGVKDFMDRARHRKINLLEIRVSVGDDMLPVFESEWHNDNPFSVPKIPAEINTLHVPISKTDKQPRLESVDIPDFFARLYQNANELSKSKQGFFKIAAFRIIGAHVAATTCAVVVVLWHPAFTYWLLGLEMVLLIAGYWIHNRLHHSNAVGIWGMSRLLAQIVTSLQAVHEIKAYPHYLFVLPMPESIRSLRRTLCVLHLQAIKDVDPTTWKKRCASYVTARVEDQRQYYSNNLNYWRKWREFSRWTFIVFTFGAVIATAAKLLHPSLGIHIDISFPALVAILAPVIAVAALSLSASFDHDFLVHSYKDARDYLDGRKPHLKDVSSDRELTALAMEIEARLLGETVTWYVRRSHSDVN